jgi:glyoxylase-like metal-dependent hydrolase (beta-lactamase superfamily II)
MSFDKTSRRKFLKIAAGAAGLSAGPWIRRTFAAQSSGNQGIVATKLADNFVLLSGAGGNVLVVHGPEGVLMVDGGLPERANALLDAVAGHTSKTPVRVLFNTHWHLEHTGGNDLLGRAGAKIIAQDNTKTWMSREIRVEWQDGKVYPARAKEARPTDTFFPHESPRKMSFGKIDIQYGHMFQAHTDGDIYVYFPGPNILMAGDVVAVGRYPILDYTTHGWIGGMTNAARDLLQIADAKTIIVPGTGPIQTRVDLQEQFDMLNTVRQRLAGMMKKGYGAKDMIAEKPTAEFDAKWGDPTLFMNSMYPGLWAHARELGGII